MNGKHMRKLTKLKVEINVLGNNKIELINPTITKTIHNN